MSKNDKLKKIYINLLKNEEYNINYYLEQLKSNFINDGEVLILEKLIEEYQKNINIIKKYLKDIKK